jgi:heat-inducible transcriptional repressor
MKAVETSAGNLTPRERVILHSIVENFVTNATPVGSRYLAKHCGLDLSPATIRNVMMDLEERGLITQPHTSAGRVPTDLGYRVYVDSLMEVQHLSRQDRRAILERLRRVAEDADQILETASHVLGQISNQLGIVLSPRFYQGIFDRMEIVPIAEKRLLVVISIKSGFVKTITMEIEGQLSQESLHETVQVLNERLHGLTLKEIKQTIDKRLRNVSSGDDTLIQTFVRSADRLFQFAEKEEFHFGGTTRIVAQPEFSDQEHIQRLLSLLENKDILVHVFNQTGEDDTGRISITIGEENREELIRNCSIITTTYHMGNMTGTLGVIGPTRMNYAYMVALVQYMARVLSETLELQLV